MCADIDFLRQYPPTHDNEIADTAHDYSVRHTNKFYPTGGDTAGRPKTSSGSLSADAPSPTALPVTRDISEDELAELTFNIVTAANTMLVTT